MAINVVYKIQKQII